MIHHLECALFVPYSPETANRSRRRRRIKTAMFLYKVKPSETFKYDDSMIWEQEAASSSLATPTTRKATIQRRKWRLHRGFICCINALKNAGLCVFYALLAQKLLTEQTELNRELCAALHCSTRTKSAILFMG